MTAPAFPPSTTILSPLINGYGVPRHEDVRAGKKSTLLAMRAPVSSLLLPLAQDSQIALVRMEPCRVLQSWGMTVRSLDEFERAGRAIIPPSGIPSRQASWRKAVMRAR